MEDEGREAFSPLHDRLEGVAGGEGRVGGIPTGGPLASGLFSLRGLPVYTPREKRGSWKNQLVVPGGIRRDRVIATL